MIANASGGILAIAMITRIALRFAGLLDWTLKATRTALNI
jgi:hypothetical protein